MLSALPTKQKPLTDDGVIPGTLQYMAPEQLEGKEADTRADIFSFGVVVYEMVTGRRAFEGKSPASLIASILEHEPPPVSKLQPSSPPTLDRVVKTCMAKDPDERWQSACDLRRELEWIKDDGSRAEVSVPVVGRHRHREQLLAAGLVLFGVIAVALAVPYFFRAPADEQVARFDIPVPQEVSIYSLSRIALSPDGRHVAWQSAADHALWLRSLDTLEVRKMPGTDGGDRPFWSPDSRFIGFFSGGKLKTVDISGGQPRTICDARGQNATWSGEGWILFSEGGNLHRVAVGGGEPPAPVAPDPSLQELQRDYPQFLPDGRHFLFHGRDQDSGDSAIYLGSLEGGAPRRLLSTDFQATYAPPGYILFMRDGNLMCQQFDVRRFELSGEPSRLAEQVAFSPAYGAQFSVSGNGVLAYRPRDRATELVWLDRGGRLLEVIGEEFAHLDLSADEKRVAVSRIDGRTGNWDVWLLDFERGLESRFTFDPSQDNYPLWSPDGSRIVFHSRRDGPHKLYTKSVMGTGKAELLAEFDVVTIPYDWSSDGRFLVFTKGSGTARDSDLWVLPLLDNGEPFPFLETEFHLTQPQISPDGRWLAYVSDESGSYEVYVRRFPRAGGQWQISNGGAYPPGGRTMGKRFSTSRRIEISWRSPLQSRTILFLR